MRDAASRVAALVLAVLLVTAPIGAVATIPDASPTDGRDARARLTAGGFAELADDRSPIEQKRVAVGVVRSIDAGGRERAKDLSLSLLDGTLAHYRDDTRVDSAAVFRNDSMALFALSVLARERNATELETASRLVYEADNETATRAIEDARRTIERPARSAAMSSTSTGTDSRTRSSAGSSRRIPRTPTATRPRPR